MHLKREASNKRWPVARKGTAYLVRPTNNPTKGLPLLIILRDILKLGQNRKEVEIILNKGEIEVNGKIRRDEKYQILLFDVIKIKSANKIYTLTYSQSKKFKIVETKSDNKISKIVGKKILPGGKIQVNLIGGENFIFKEKVNIGDSAVIDFDGKKIAKIIHLEKGSKVFVIKGKHIGEEGKVIEINDKIVEIDSNNNNNKINISKDNLIAI